MKLCPTLPISCFKVLIIILRFFFKKRKNPGENKPDGCRIIGINCDSSGQTSTYVQPNYSPTDQGTCLICVCNSRASRGPPCILGSFFFFIGRAAWKCSLHHWTAREVPRMKRIFIQLRIEVGRTPRHVFSQKKYKTS